MQLLRQLSKSEQAEIIEAEPNYINNLDENEILDFITRENDNSKFIKYLPEKLQIELLTKEKKFHVYKGDADFKIYNYNTKLRNFIYKLNCFSPEAVIKAIILLKQDIKTKGDSDWIEKQSKINFLNDIDISVLPDDTQIKLALLDSKFMKKMSESASKKFIGNNPYLIKKLDHKMQINLIKQNPTLFSALDKRTKANLINSDYELWDVISDQDKLLVYYAHIQSNLGVTDIEAYKREITRTSYRNLIFNSSITDSIRDPQSLIELGRFEPSILSTWTLNNNFKAYKKIIDIYKNYIKIPEIQKELDVFLQRFASMDSLKQSTTSENMPKIFLNDKVISKVEPQVLIEYLRNPDSRDILMEIVGKTYGDEAVKILEERPNVTLSQIPNLYIFDPVIFEKFGKGTVNNALSYETSANCILGELARYPEKMQKFIEFSEIFGKEKDDAVGFNNKLLAFKQLEDLLKSIDIKSLTDKQKATLRLVYSDLFVNRESENPVISLTSLEDLDSYRGRRNKLYDEYVKKSVDILDVKDAISRRLFGMRYDSGIGENFEHTDMSLNSMIYYYNLKNFVSDERTITGGNFTQDELDMLELAKIISSIGDIDILKEIYFELEKREDIILQPEDFACIRDKVPLQYSQEIINTLLTVEEAKKRADSNEKGISYEKTEDGFEIIRLDGADFRMMIHTTGMNNSNLRLPRNADVSEIWKNFEDGCSTISNCLIEPKMLKSCAKAGEFTFGFSNIPNKQIIGMSHHDAHISHSKRRIDPEFEYYSVLYNYSDELVRKTAAQITGQEAKDQSHPYNEIAIYRRDIDQDSENYGERIMPDYIVVFGKASSFHKELAKKFAKENGIPLPIIEIDEKAYGDRTYERGYTKEEHSTKREKGDVVKTVDSIINKSDEDESR